MKHLTLIIGILMMSVLLLTGTPPATAADKPITLTIASHMTPRYQDLFPVVQQFVDRINELGKGKVKVEFYHSQTLFKVRELVPALINGSCEMIFHTSTHTTGSWPEVGGLSLPFLYQDDFDAKEHWVIGGKLLNLVNKEMGKKYGVRILAPGILPGLILATKGKPVEQPGDLKGMKIRGTGKPDSAAVKACGASPTFLSSGELYEALQRGTIDGVVTHVGTLVARNLGEVLDNLIFMRPRLASWGYQIYVLNSTFEKWPKEVQDIIEVAAVEYDYNYLNNALSYLRSDLLPTLSKQMKIMALSPEQTKRFRDAVLPTYQNWLKNVDKKFGEKLLELSGAPLLP